ncbi:MAG: hypothetical protein DLM58_06905 [Pseudonocardiales bacterium]|nr:MAG: hypothetical protein DLM58_06905 [Pseudonocardiales bacterium]
MADVAGDDRDVVGQGHSFAYLPDGVRDQAVKQVVHDGERQAAIFEEVDRGEAVGQLSVVDENAGAYRAMAAYIHDLTADWAL